MSTSMYLSSSQLPLPRRDWALFLDFDGTLVSLAAHPDDVRVSPRLKTLLGNLEKTFDGAVAVISGRSLDQLEDLLAPISLPMAGIHGLEWRDADGTRHTAVDQPAQLASCRDALAAFVEARPGLYYEDKSVSLTLHYRGAPELAEACRAFFEAQHRALGETFELVPGKCVLELRPSGYHKGTSVARLLDEAPAFRGRTPVFIGDDVTDEDAFRIVNARGGHSVRVGSRDETVATCYLESVQEVLTWLESLTTQDP
ncbi:MULTISPECIES: trehalose-phosphatase [Halomonadaceae]|uniref:Trehalose 6-phosphate phosphatase n=1 Tax=Modicisalibacter zincidurans TaxID=1178777 RepID=A0ABP9RIE1_9GAMM|nr:MULTISPECIES: trehalose-phosphatase [Halomonas]MCD6009783.1 trehalose-phosphatase [Halomonas sp. IOP_31]